MGYVVAVLVNSNSTNYVPDVVVAPAPAPVRFLTTPPATPNSLEGETTTLTQIEVGEFEVNIV